MPAGNEGYRMKTQKLFFDKINILGGYEPPSYRMFNVSPGESFKSNMSTHP